MSAEWICVHCGRVYEDPLPCTSDDCPAPPNEPLRLRLRKGFVRIELRESRLMIPPIGSAIRPGASL